MSENVLLLFDVLNAGRVMQMVKQVRMPILPVGSIVEAWSRDDTGPDEDNLQEISHWFYRHDGAIECHFTNPGFPYEEIGYLAARGYVVKRRSESETRDESDLQESPAQNSE